MPFTPKARSAWDARLARASELEKQYAFAADVLRFYREVAAFQQGVYNELRSSRYAPPFPDGHLPRELDLSPLLPMVWPFLNMVQREAPEELARSAQELESRGTSEWAELLASCWRHPAVAAADSGTWFVTRALFQPLAEYLAERATVETGSNYAKAVCPFCGQKPALGTLRPEGDGAKRSLICSLCSTEWQFRRVFCPGCGETDLEKLPIFTSDDYQHLRVEACDTCKCFIKTVDLNRNGNAIPVVDELATIPLTLWAIEKGYTRLEPNLLGM